MSASAVLRCTRHSRSPSRALPRWRTRRSTFSSRSAVALDKERVFAIAASLGQQYIEPGKHRQYDGRGEHGVAAAIGIADLEAVAGIPSEVPNAAAQVIEERDRPAEQQQYPDRRGNKRVRRREHLAASGHRDQPPGEEDRAHDQRNAGQPVQDRQDRRDLKTVPIRKHEWRQWAFHGDTPSSVLIMPCRWFDLASEDRVADCSIEQHQRKTSKSGTNQRLSCVPDSRRWRARPPRTRAPCRIEPSW